jgi:uncharacterized membrane protein
MIRTSATLMNLSIAVVVVGAALLWSGQLDSPSSFVSSAEARIGRPLTPMSYAGVARRTTRRAVAVGAAGAAVYGGAVMVAPAPVVVAPVCGQAVDAYGRIVTVCR